MVIQNVRKLQQQESHHMNDRVCNLYFFVPHSEWQWGCSISLWWSLVTLQVGKEWEIAAARFTAEICIRMHHYLRDPGNGAKES